MLALKRELWGGAGHAWVLNTHKECQSWLKHYFDFEVRFFYNVVIICMHKVEISMKSITLGHDILMMPLKDA